MSKGFIKHQLNNVDIVGYDNQALNMFAENFMLADKGRIWERGGQFVKSMAYTFTNENLDKIFKIMNVKGKKVLTVGSSGDQALYAIGKGAKKVTIIDANPMTLPLTEFKLACIKNLSFEEFYEFFSSCDFIYQIENIYSRISHDLSKYSKDFWDTLILNLPNNSNGKTSIARALFQEGRYPVCRRDHVGFYREKALFDNIRDNMQTCDIEYIQAELQEFPQKADDTYDYILLSNISDYVRADVFNEVVYALRNRLTPNGKMQIHYGFRGMDYCTYKVSKKFLEFSNDDFLIDLNEYLNKKHKVDICCGGFYRKSLRDVSTLYEKMVYGEAISPNITFVSKGYLDRHMKKLSRKAIRDISFWENGFDSGSIRENLLK